MKRVSPLAVLLLVALGLSWTARTPEAGVGWRLAFVLVALLGVPVALWAARAVQPSVRVFIGVALGLRLCLLPLAPTLSDDGYRYVWDGAVQVQKGWNPYAETPREHVARGFEPPVPLEALNSPDYPSVYPPVSQLVFAFSARAGGERFGSAWLIYKLLVVLVELGGLWLLAREIRPERLALYAWHPLALVEIAGQGHTEGLAIGFLSLGLAMLMRYRDAVAGVGLAGAAWVKMWPVVLLTLWGQRRPWLVFGCGVAGAALLVPYVHGLDFGAVGGSLGLYAGTFDFYSAPYVLLKAALWPLAGEGSGRLASGVMALGFLIVTAVIAIKQHHSTVAPEAATATLVVAYTLASSTLHPWHLAPALWAASVGLQSRRGRAALLWFVRGARSPT